MIAESIVLLLHAASVVGFDFFVQRNDGKGVCVSDERESREKCLVPIYDLQDRFVPPDKEELWTDGWQMKHLKIRSKFTRFFHTDHKIVTTNGSKQFKSIASGYWHPNFLIQASNATLIWSQNENQDGPSYRIHLNHLVDPEQGRWETWAECCANLSTTEQKCKRLETLEDNMGGADILSEGSRWTTIAVFGQDSENLTLSIGNRQGYLKWNNTCSRGIRPRYFFARTDSSPGVFFVPLWTSVWPIFSQSENEMSRSFSVGPEGNLCLDTEWMRHGDNGRFELLNESGQVVRQGRLIADEKDMLRLDFQLGRGGDFRLRFLDINETLSHVDLCASEMKIWSTSHGCSVHNIDWLLNFLSNRSLDEKFFSAQLNRSLLIDLTPAQMQKVCAALEVGSDDPTIKFSSRWGADFRECPNAEESGASRTSASALLCFYLVFYFVVFK